MSKKPFLPIQSSTAFAVQQSVDFGPYREGSVGVLRGDNQFKIHYRIYNESSKNVPLLVVHGGPSLPSQYLYPLVPLVGIRPVIFFDQLGCGKSSEPTDIDMYSIEKSVKDMKKLVSTVIRPGKPYFLFGHSYGGSLAYEFVSKSTEKAEDFPRCQALILCNAIHTMRLANTEYDRLSAANPETFWKDHACTVGIPPSLDRAMYSTGRVWGGMGAVIDFVAKPPMCPNDATPQTLLLSGSLDFALPTTGEDVWSPLIPHLKATNFDGCAHYPFYENNVKFKQAVMSFLADAEEQRETEAVATVS